jgi:hypothetical protein
MFSRRGGSFRTVRLDRLESSDKEELEKRQASRKLTIQFASVVPYGYFCSDSQRYLALYVSFLQHRKALTALRHQLRLVEEEKEELKSMLQTLQEGYNPNYQVCRIILAGWGRQILKLSILRVFL